MSNGLSVSRLIRTTVSLSPQAAQYANFGTFLILGASNVIDVTSRMRSYTGIDDVLADFGSTAPEYLSAQLFFSQSPKPAQVYVGRWAKTATAGLLNGGVLTASEQAIASWQAITTGSMKITVDGTLKTLTALNFSTATNLNGVASIFTTALSGAIVTWTGARFVVTSPTTGASSSIAYATANSSGVDVSAKLKLTADLASPPVPGIVAETPLECVGIFDNTFTTRWYGCTFADAITDDESIAVAGFIEASGRHVYGATITNTSVLDATVTTDLASRLRDLGYSRTWSQYSENPYAVASFFGRAATVDFNANNSTITLMYKQEPGVAAETLTETQANALRAKNCNVFVNYDNDTAIVQYGVMSSGDYFDEIQGADWMSNKIQTDSFNLLYTSAKIPQTDAGNNILATVIEGACAAGVNNGLLAPGTWTQEGFGRLSYGDYLPKGYYVYAPPISSQTPADRAARKSVPFQVAAKLAGAIHTVDILININR